MTLFDYVLACSFFLAMPLIGLWKSPAAERALREGRHELRIRMYFTTMATQWFLFAGLVALWIWTDRSPALLGVVAPAGIAFWITAAVVVVGSGVLAMQVLKCRTDPAEREKIRTQLKDVSLLLPHTRRELRAFYGLSVTAGICEEVFYRGFLFWIVGMFGGPVWAALILSALMFGAGHLYQGAKNAAQIIALGLIFGLVYWVSGSIWLPIALHIAIDVISGLTAHIAVSDETSSSVPQPAA